MKTEFHVLGIPIPQGSQVYATTSTGRAYGRYTNHTHLMAWRESIAQAAWRSTLGEQFTGPVQVKALFYFERPKAHYTTKGLLRSGASKYVTKKPDIDKIARALLDSLESSILMNGDETVIGLYVSKHWADDHPQGVHVIVEDVGLT